MSEIWLADADGGSPRRLTSHRFGAADVSPTWSPDGERIAFLRSRPVDPGVTTEPHLYVMNADGSAVRRLTTRLRSFQIEYTDISDPEWSPDGARIAFNEDRHRASRGPAHGQEVYLVDPHTRSRTRLTRNSVDDLYPSWSPDGKEIAFTRVLPNGRVELRVMRRDGSRQRRLARVKGGPASAPVASWSPDGSQIIFSRSVSGPRGGLYVVDAGGGEIAKVLSGALCCPDWAPR